MKKSIKIINKRDSWKFPGKKKGNFYNQTTLGFLIIEGNNG